MSTRSRTQAICLILVLACAVIAQEPAQPKEPSHQDLLDALNQLRKEAAETKAEVKLLGQTRMQRQAQRELRQRELETQRERQRAAQLAKKKDARIELQRRRTRVAEARLETARTKLDTARREALIEHNINTRLAALDAGEVPKNIEPQEQRSLMAALVVDRARLKEKIRKNNNKRRCRWFRIGCIK